ncbi:MAG: hypothetical protein WA139_00150 [Candidatus Aenigmatarchaeota archaeon]
MSGEFDFFGTLSYLGLTPSVAVPLTIFGIIAYLVFSRRLNKHLNPIKLAITEIQTIFSVGGQDIKHSLTEVSNSPLQPTDFGLELLKKSGMEEYVKANEDSLIKKVKEKLKKGYTAYDVQEQSIKLMVELKDGNMLNTIKEYAFNNGMSIETILRLGGLMLRDKFLKGTQLK